MNRGVPRGSGQQSETTVREPVRRGREGCREGRCDQEVRLAEPWGRPRPAPGLPPDAHQQWAGMSCLAGPELGAAVPGPAGTAGPTPPASVPGKEMRVAGRDCLSAGPCWLWSLPFPSARTPAVWDPGPGQPRFLPARSSPMGPICAHILGQ